MGTKDRWLSTESYPTESYPTGTVSIVSDTGTPATDCVPKNIFGIGSYTYQ